MPPYVIFPDSTLLEMLRSRPTTMAEMARVSGVGARKLERYGEAFLEVLGGEAETPKAVVDIRHELISLARAGMTPLQIAGQLQCSEKNVYTLLAEAIGHQQLSLEQAWTCLRTCWGNPGQLPRRRGRIARRERGRRTVRRAGARRCPVLRKGCPASRIRTMRRGKWNIPGLSLCYLRQVMFAHSRGLASSQAPCLAD